MMNKDNPSYTKLFYDWNDSDYRQFMEQVCHFIEPRFYLKKEMILEI